MNFQTHWLQIHVNEQGFITSLRNRQTNEEYCPAGHPSPLLALYAGEAVLKPVSARYTPKESTIRLTYPGGAQATVSVRQTSEYLRFQLEALYHRGNTDNIVWGPVNTTISATIGDIIGVVRDGKFALGMMALNDRTISGEPCPSDMAGMYYYIHSPDPQQFRIAPQYHEGQRFSIGGDGVNDVAFYSHPEEYFRMSAGNAAELQPAFGSSLCMHARDRRKPYTFLYTLIPGFSDNNQPRHQVTDTMNVDVVGSAIALYGCPDARGGRMIEDIVLAEGLPCPLSDGKWTKDPASFKPDIAWYGIHDSTFSYANQLGLKGIQDEGLGEYYINPADRWAGKRIDFSGGRSETIREFTDRGRPFGILYGLHSLCEFIQPPSSDVHPVPNEHLQTVLRTRLGSGIGPVDTGVVVEDTSFLNERGTWHDNQTNVLKIGNELMTYEGVTAVRPYTLLGVKRGRYKTAGAAHAAGEELSKLQMNCYHGFVPDMKLQLDYADFYARLLVDGGMNYIDFDGMESCMYQNQGYYSFKIFFGRLFDTFHKLGGKYLRVTGSTVTEGSWHYLSICNLGGGDHMFSPVTNKWGIEGKDMRTVFESNYFPGTFGIQDLRPDWSLYDAENLQAKSIGWNATYMLGLSQESVEHCGEKKAIFKALRTWEDARETESFNDEQKRELKDLTLKFHLERTGNDSFLLYPIRETRHDGPLTPDSAATPPGSTAIRDATDSQAFSLVNPFAEQPLELAARISGPTGAWIKGMSLQVGSDVRIHINDTLSAGEFLLMKNRKWYLADRNRNVRKEIGTSENALLPPGNTDMRWSVEKTSDAAARLEVVVSAVGPAQQVMKQR